MKMWPVDLHNTVAPVSQILCFWKRKNFFLI